MKKYYLNLVTLVGLIPYNYTNKANPQWGNTQKEKLTATNLEDAEKEAKEIFEKHRSFQFGLLDNELFSKSLQKTLKNSFPKEILILEEIEHRFSV